MEDFTILKPYFGWAAKQLKWEEDKFFDNIGLFTHGRVNVAWERA